MINLRDIILDIARAGGRVRLEVADEWPKTDMPPPSGTPLSPRRGSLLDTPIGRLPRTWPLAEPTPDESCIHGRIGPCPDCYRDSF
jgi:hypothetical protein